MFLESSRCTNKEIERELIMEVTDFLEIVIFCLSLLIVIPILMVIWIDWERIDSKRRNRWK